MWSAVRWCMLMLAVGVGARELDPAACAARFDVQRDKIIRTEESREMGARYLSELDVGARRECLRLCCETDACDVFVFEEKSPGSCYLFNCGPPEDFRCKFTAHGNFSSGVLALSRRLAELQDQERLARHEQELANLRSPTSSTASSTPEPHAAPAPSPQPAPAPVPTPPPPPSPQPRRCSRYQFECRRGGECIAVYNACDGVPQCADGSDEAPELGCPASPAPPAPPAPPVPPAAPPAAPPATRPPPPPPPAPPLTQVQESAEEAAGGAAGAGGAGGEVWPHRLTQAQLQHRYNERVGAAGVAGPEAGSHIFSHKGGLLQENAFEPPPAAGWPRRGWPPQTGMDGMGNMGMSAPHAWGPYAPPDWDAEPRRAWPVPPRPEPEIPVYLPPKTMPEMPIMYSSQQQTLRDSPKKGLDLMTKSKSLETSTEPAGAPPAPRDPGLDPREDRQPAPAPAPAPIENTTKKKMLKDPPPDEVHRSSAAGATGAAGAAAMLAADEHDGLSERPPAAVLLLVLGTLLTAALGALLACRARAARRRRRAHPRYALDADYLVNGMYL